VIRTIPKIKFLITASLVSGILLVGAVPIAAAMSITPAYRYTTTSVASGNTYITASALASDTSGNTYTVGPFQGSVNFAGNSGNDTQTTSNFSTYITKHAVDGSYDWTRTPDTDTGPGGQAGFSAVATDTSGNVYAAGNFSGTVIFDGPGGSHSQTSNDNAVFINKYSPDGTYVSTQYIIPPSDNDAEVYLAGIGFDTSDNMYLAGSFQGTQQDPINFGSIAGATDNKTTNASDAFVTRVNADGSYGWTRTTVSPNDGLSSAQAQEMTVTPTGTVDLAGGFGGTVNFAGSTGTDNQTDTSGNSSGFVMQVNANSSYGWTRTMNPINNGSNYYTPNLSGITADPVGNVYVSGSFQGTVNFAGTSGTDEYTVGEDNFGDPLQGGFLTKYSASGSYGSTKAFISSGYSNAFAVAVTADMNGDIYLLSGFGGTVDFASGTNSTDNHTSDSYSTGALTMYEPDGSYGWTRTFDPTSDYGGDLNTGIGALATDKLGHVDATSNFYGTVNFAGSGGNDTYTSTNTDNGDTFLTSYTSFIPSTNAVTSSISTAVTPNTTAPDTGFTVNKPAIMPAMLLLLTGFSLAVLAYKVRTYELFKS
jgi:hypothetical protein